MAKREPWRVEPGFVLGGRHHPRSGGEFAAWFSDEDAAAAWIAAVRWVDGVTCPRCGLELPVSAPAQGKSGWCGSCRRAFSVTSGTVLGHTKLPLRTWLTVAWMMTEDGAGVPATAVQRALGVSYGTAWHLLHKLRSVMAQAASPPLGGAVEVDDVFLGGVKYDSAADRDDGVRTLVAIAVECVPGRRDSTGRTRIARIPNRSAASLREFLTANVAPGTTVLTDRWAAYRGACAGRYDHRPSSLVRVDEHSHTTLARVMRVASALDRWMLDTHQRTVADEHLGAYLDEFVFRIDPAAVRAPGLLFHGLVTRVLHWAPVRRVDVIGGRA